MGGQAWQTRSGTRARSYSSATATATAPAPPPATTSSSSRAAAAAPVEEALPDAYLEWAQLTCWLGFGPEAGEEGKGVDSADPETGQPGEWVRIIGCAPDARARQAVLDLQTEEGLMLAPAYQSDLQSKRAGEVFFSARLRQDALPRLSAAEVQWELSMAVRTPLTAQRASAHGYYGQDRDITAFQLADVFEPESDAKTASVPRRVAAEPIEGEVIAVIDFGVPFLNRRFGERLVAVWDQSSAPDTSPRAKGVTGSGPRVQPGWALPHAFEYGRELDKAGLARRRQELHERTAWYDEARAYAGMNHLRTYDDPRRRIYFASHGAHVLDIAGGERDPLLDDQSIAVGAQARGTHSPQLIFVQLPALTASDSSGGSLAAYLLDALRYIDARCHRTKSKVVVNISYGSFAGRHDGGSMLERAMDALMVRRRSNFAIVLAAGNARQAACHVRRRVRYQRSAQLRFVVVPQDTTDTFVEVWYRPTGTAASLAVRVRRHGEAWSGWVGPGESQTRLDLASSAAVALVWHGTRAPHEPGGPAMVLIALRPSAKPIDDEGPLIEPGVWEAELRLDHARAGDSLGLDAWIERDDPGGYDGRPQSHFVGLEPQDQKETLNSIATGKWTVPVGGFVLEDGVPAPYSSVGTRPPCVPGGAARPTPRFYAACERDASDRGINAAAVRSSDVLKMNGTSVAAPALARRLLQVMARRKVAYDGWEEAIDKYFRDHPDPFIRAVAASAAEQATRPTPKDAAADPAPRKRRSRAPS